MAKKANNPQVTLTVYATGERFIEGTVVRQDKNSVTVRYKKPRSSKFLVETFARSKVLSVWEGEETAQIIVAGSRYELDTYVGELSTDEQGNYVVTGEDFTATVNATADVEIFEEDEEEPVAKKAKKDDKKAKVAKKAKKEDDEDEEEEETEEDDEDEEEEEPKKKAKSKKETKVAKKAKDEDEEDDEDEDEEW